MPTHRTHGVPIGEDSTTTRRLLSAPGSEAKTSRDNGVARQRALVGNSLDDEQWSDNLTNPPTTLDNPSRDHSRVEGRT